METFESVPQQPAPRQNRSRRWGRIAGAAALAGAVAGGLALTHGQGSGTIGAANAATGSTPAAKTIASGTTSTTSGTQPAVPGPGGMPGSGGPGRFGGMGGFGGMAGGIGLTVTGVSGNTITATGPFSRNVTITVTGSTTYTEAGSTVSLAAVQKGEQIAVRGTRTSPGVLTATSVSILLPREGGLVTGVSGDTITTSGMNGKSESILVTAATKYQKAGTTATLTDVTPGVAINAEGTQNSDGSLTAQVVMIEMPRAMGQVTAVTSGSYTLSGRNGSALTVTTSGSTTYVSPTGSTVQASAITSGTYIMAEGTLSADGKTLAATRITVLPAGSNGGWGGHGMGGFGHRGGGPGGMGSPTPGSGSQGQTGTGGSGTPNTGTQSLSGSV